MKAYWDSSALVEAVSDPALRLRLQSERGFTRTHALAEIFSALTGNPQVRFDADWSARTIEQLIGDLDFVDLSPAELIAALKQARRRVSVADTSMISCMLRLPTSPLLSTSSRRT